MAIVSGLPASYSGLIHHRYSKQPCWFQRSNRIRFHDHNAVLLASKTNFGGRVQCSLVGRCRRSHVGAAGSNRQLSFNEELPEEPFWLSLIKDGIWALRSLFTFLVEQPSQLKYIEWPSFQSTLKTATLTLVLVAALIVALSSVDCVLCYLLALLLRRTP